MVLLPKNAMNKTLPLGKKKKKAATTTTNRKKKNKKKSKTKQANNKGQANKPGLCVMANQMIFNIIAIIGNAELRLKEVDKP